MWLQRVMLLSALLCHVLHALATPEIGTAATFQWQQGVGPYPLSGQPSRCPGMRNMQFQEWGESGSVEFSHANSERASQVFAVADASVAALQGSLTSVSPGLTIQVRAPRSTNNGQPYAVFRLRSNRAPDLQVDPGRDNERFSHMIAVPTDGQAHKISVSFSMFSAFNAFPCAAQAINASISGADVDFIGIECAHSEAYEDCHLIIDSISALQADEQPDFNVYPLPVGSCCDDDAECEACLISRTFRMAPAVSFCSSGFHDICYGQLLGAAQALTQCGSLARQQHFKAAIQAAANYSSWQVRSSDEPWCYPPEEGKETLLRRALQARLETNALREPTDTESCLGMSERSSQRNDQAFSHPLRGHPIPDGLYEHQSWDGVIDEPQAQMPFGSPPSGTALGGGSPQPGRLPVVNATATASVREAFFLGPHSNATVTSIGGSYSLFFADTCKIALIAAVATWVMLLCQTI
eukprot:TRINITY_DN22463_c1_g5_i1.p1 TRINITY_DN22463_c1_g5~~TRINITY_DN22463_c1_g5_i1.p1  ORF type:complete len:467 (-),score=50.49 TRINITY_DN22463_c1_g5_i1:543-1943(-)